MKKTAKLALVPFFLAACASRPAPVPSAEAPLFLNIKDADESLEIDDQFLKKSRNVGARKVGAKSKTLLNP
ncbi:MAG: hypothetical protein AAF203_03135 [Pseudomonadota bacterium]